jgi:hypothetical protein
MASLGELLAVLNTSFQAVVGVLLWFIFQRLGRLEKDQVSSAGRERATMVAVAELKGRIEGREERKG